MSPARGVSSLCTFLPLWPAAAATYYSPVEHALDILLAISFDRSAIKYRANQKIALDWCETVCILFTGYFGAGQYLLCLNCRGSSWRYGAGGVKTKATLVLGIPLLQCQAGAAAAVGTARWKGRCHLAQPCP